MLNGVLEKKPIYQPDNLGRHSPCTHSWRAFSAQQPKLKPMFPQIFDLTIVGSKMVPQKLSRDIEERFTIFQRAFLPIGHVSLARHAQRKSLSGQKGALSSYSISRATMTAYKRCSAQRPVSCSAEWPSIFFKRQTTSGLPHWSPMLRVRGSASDTSLQP